MHYWIFGVEALLIPNIWIYFLGKTSFVRHPERKFVVYRVFILARYLKFPVINTIKIPSHFPFQLDGRGKDLLRLISSSTRKVCSL